MIFQHWLKSVIWKILSLSCSCGLLIRSLMKTDRKAGQIKTNPVKIKMT